MYWILFVATPLSDHSTTILLGGENTLHHDALAQGMRGVHGRRRTRW
ncbi:hypothetical protein PWG71_21215 [Nocardiopsis sp. N85]|nr:hypothetical protein [Nocardiopsis sp. N85]MDE3723919.1 hypothetical protein [Nocardiopsis sp. N85]